ncbi:MAG: 6-phosphofructokinase [Luteibaculaceae bacterium]
MKTNTNIKKIGVFTSGGDSPGMNAAIRAVVRTGIHYGIEVAGIYRGFDGLIEGDYIELGARSVSKIIDKGGTILKSARSKEFRTKEGREKAYHKIKEAGIEALVVIGGDGSFTGASIFCEEFDIPVIGVPGTIDNDIPHTDYTIGYDTASNTVIEAVDKIRDTANSHNRLFFVEVMGRDSGFIALRTGIATGAICIMLPEEEMSIDEIVAILERGQQSKKSSSIIIVGEGDANGGAHEVAKKVTEKYTEYDTKVTILGHLQRGGSPSCFDRVLASMMGVGAVEGLLNGKSNTMVGIVNDKITYTPIHRVLDGKSAINEELYRISKILSI